MRTIACLVLIGGLAHAQWPRNTAGMKGVHKDFPPSHPLAYFQVDPCLRPSKDPLLAELECSWPGKPSWTPAELDTLHKTRTELEDVGKIGNFEIYDLWYL